MTNAFTECVVEEAALVWLESNGARSVSGARKCFKPESMRV
jgi:hypothetical protein